MDRPGSRYCLRASTPSHSGPLSGRPSANGVSLSGRYVIAFNGEIYNHYALRKRLATEGHTQWRGTSDTETLLAALSYWGIRRTLQACIGMFAIALWDNKTRRLTLARDRMGEKPLYYGWVGQHFLFGSELKALRAHHEWNATINRDAMACQLRLSYIPAPLTIYQQVFKLEPGHLLQITQQTTPGSQTHNRSLLVVGSTGDPNPTDAHRQTST